MGSSSAEIRFSALTDRILRERQAAERADQQTIGV
jgi:hypothetical protein